MFNSLVRGLLMLAPILNYVRTENQLQLLHTQYNELIQSVKFSTLDACMVKVNPP